MALEGSLRDFDLFSLFNMIKIQGKSGTLDREFAQRDDDSHGNGSRAPYFGAACIAFRRHDHHAQYERRENHCMQQIITRLPDKAVGYLERHVMKPVGG